MTEELANIMNQICLPNNFSQGVNEPGKKGKLCLNMIVKNESRIIERLLESVLSIIDTYCICDTGSTDDTIQKIRDFMLKAGKPGIVFSEPFKNFGHNRTVALDRAADWGEYALLLDADMKLVIEPGFSKDSLVENGYSIMQRAGNLEYMNIRLAKTGIGVKCVSPTHEYYDFPNGGTGKLTTLWINDIGDGGAKADKFARDIRLLEEGIREEPKNGRYHFYLANSYKNSNKYLEAIAYYKKRVEIGGWIEEIFYSCYEIGNCYKELKDMANAVFWWFEAYDRHPKRSESLYEIVKYYREIGKQQTAHLVYTQAMKIPYPKDDVLFIRKDVYDYLFEYENSVLAYYSKTPIDHYKYLTLIGKEYHKDNVLSNYKFYVKKLSQIGGVDHDFCGKTEKLIGDRMDSFVSSSPCILQHSEGYLLNVRYVNYTINPNGSYSFKHSDGKITTLQHVHWLNSDFSIYKSVWIDQVQDVSLRYQGIEDVKIFSHCGQILFLGTVENAENGNVSVGHGTYDLSKPCLYSKPFMSPTGNRCEKNWCYFHNAKGDLKVVYKWKPLTIGDIVDDQYKTTYVNDSVPDFFRDLRGSSNGFLLDGEVWFLCHLVEYTTPRHYYHIIVVFDAATYAYKRHSIMFKFHSDCIEYGLGFLVEPSRFVFSYSRMDRTSSVMTLPRAVAERELFP
jgi:hypothetical protein